MLRNLNELILPLPYIKVKGLRGAGGEFVMPYKKVVKTL